MSDRIEIRTASLDEIIDLRHAILRAGLPRETAIFAGDQLPTTRHFGAFIEREGTPQALGCASFHRNHWEDAPAWQLRGMATSDAFRGQGLGRKLLETAEQQLSSEADSPRVFWCNARVPALGFYQWMGWQVVSEQFDIPTAGPHVRMVKQLDSSKLDANRH